MNNKALISFDFAIKYLLRSKGDYDIVEGFISALLKACGYGSVKIKALLESESNKEQLELKQAIADMIVEDEQRNKYIVEIDRSYTSMFIHKACFNSSRLIVDSMSANDDYSTIKKIFHINLLYFPFGKMEKPLYHGQTIFREVDNAHPVDMHISDIGGRIFDAHSIMPEYFVISIPLFNDVIREELDEWLYMMKHSEVREEFQSPYMKKVSERLMLLKLTPKELAAYRKYRSESLKERDRIVSAREEGIEEGATSKATEIAFNMLQQKLDHKLIAQVTGLSVEDITKLENKQ
ncbi:MAG: Rpn family recombination-promoting nuclease/putative transposase [Bacteroidota bacterium]